MNEALELLADGAEIKAVERAAKDFGMPMGPITLYDVVGPRHRVLRGPRHARGVSRIGSPPRPFCRHCVEKPAAWGKSPARASLRTKTRRAKARPTRRWPTSSGRTFGKNEKFTDEQITTRLFLPMVLEATRILEAKVVRDVRDVDLGLIFGMGFPPFKGGLLFWADTLGAAKIVEMLKPLESLGAGATDRRHAAGTGQERQEVLRSNDRNDAVAPPIQRTDRV